MMELKIPPSRRWFQLILGIILLVHIECDCTFPKEVIKNGSYIYRRNKDAKEKTAPELYVLRFNCSTGYERIGPRFIECVDGNWTNVVPICRKMTCFDPPNIANGDYEILGESSQLLTIDTLVTYSCDNGYQLRDASASNLICVLGEGGDKAVWAGKMPFCEEIKKCHDPGVSKHGTRNGDCCDVVGDCFECLEGSILRFTCDEDFELIGEEEMTCLRSGVWSHNRPLCRPSRDVRCDLPPAVPHGVVTGDKEGDYFLPYDEVEVVCEPGYAYNGSIPYIMCLEDGEWEAEFEECTVVYCDRPEPLVHGTILKLETTDLFSLPYKSELTYVCDSGYRLVGGDSWRICRENGWSGKTPYCEETLCPDPGVPEDGDREGDAFVVGAKVRFKCFTGYYLLGSFERYCMPNGQWTGELSRCDTSSNYCPNPGIPINGFKNSSRYDIGDKVGFSCRSGFVHVGSKARVCMPNRTWSGVETKCLSPYDYDTTAEIGDILKAKMEEEFDENLTRFKKLQAASALFGPRRGRTLDLSYEGRLILYFAFDVSGSVGEHNFRISKDFAKAIVKKVGVSRDGTRVGALTFSSESLNVFVPNQFQTTKDVLDALDGTEYTGGGTSASSALSLIKENLALDDEYLEKSRKTVVFFITDGHTNMGGSPEEEAEILKKIGVDIYCIGITGDVRKDLLYKIASTSLHSNVERPNVFILKDYAEFPWLIQEITNGTLDYSQCGLGKKDVTNYNRDGILNGKQSDEPWPWMAALYALKPGTKDVKESKLTCGDSVINNNFILTAAHCMFEENMAAIHNRYRLRGKEEFIVKLGLTDITDESKWTLIQEFNVKTMHIHPKYKRGPSFDYDIALLELDRPIKYGPDIRPICLPPKELPPNSSLYRANEFGWAIGWGHSGFVSADGVNIIFTISKDLKEMRLPIQSRERCGQSLVAKNYSSSYFTERMFCAGDGQTGIDTCRGDSGGPLMRPQMNEEGYLYWTQVGIVSWGIGCGVKGLYGYYTHVHNLLSWIEEKTRSANDATEELPATNDATEGDELATNNAMEELPATENVARARQHEKHKRNVYDFFFLQTRIEEQIKARN